MNNYDPNNENTWDLSTTPPKNIRFLESLQSQIQNEFNNHSNITNVYKNLNKIENKESKESKDDTDICDKFSSMTLR